MQEELPATLITWDEVYSLCQPTGSAMRQGERNAHSALASQNHFQICSGLLCRNGQLMAMAYLSLGSDEDLSSMIAKMQSANVDAPLLRTPENQERKTQSLFHQFLGGHHGYK